MIVPPPCDLTRVNQPAITSPAPPLAGMLRFIRYGFMPNRLRYCGGDENRLLFDHAVEPVSYTHLTLPTILRV